MYWTNRLSTANTALVLRHAVKMFMAFVQPNWFCWGLLSQSLIIALCVICVYLEIFIVISQFCVFSSLCFLVSMCLFSLLCLSLHSFSCYFIFLYGPRCLNFLGNVVHRKIKNSKKINEEADREETKIKSMLGYVNGVFAGTRERLMIR